MSRNPADIPTLRLVYDYRPNENIRAQQGLVYKAGGDRELLFDVDVPEFQAGRNQPVVVFVHGDGPTQMIEHIKDWNVYRDWGGLIAAYGMVAVTFNHRASSGEADSKTVQPM